MKTVVVLLGLILLVLIYVGRDIDTIRRMVFEMRLCSECHGTGRIPEERDRGGEECGACKGTGKKR